MLGEGRSKEQALSIHRHRLRRSDEVRPELAREFGARLLDGSFRLRLRAAQEDTGRDRVDHGEVDEHPKGARETPLPTRPVHGPPRRKQTVPNVAEDAERVPAWILRRLVAHHAVVRVRRVRGATEPRVCGNATGHVLRFRAHAEPGRGRVAARAQTTDRAARPEGPAARIGIARQHVPDAADAEPGRAATHRGLPGSKPRLAHHAELLRVQAVHRKSPPAIIVISIDETMSASTNAAPRCRRLRRVRACSALNGSPSSAMAGSVPGTNRRSRTRHF